MFTNDVDTVNSLSFKQVNEIMKSSKMHDIFYLD